MIPTTGKQERRCAKARPLGVTGEDGPVHRLRLEERAIERALVAVNAQYDAISDRAMARRAMKIVGRAHLNLSVLAVRGDRGRPRGRDGRHAMTAKKRVRIVAPWSSFYGHRGVVTGGHARRENPYFPMRGEFVAAAHKPDVMVLVDGEREPMRFMTSEVE